MAPPFESTDSTHAASATVEQGSTLHDQFHKTTIAEATPGKSSEAMANGKDVLPPLQLATEVHDAVQSNNPDKLAHANQDVANAAKAAYDQHHNPQDVANLQNQVNTTIHKMDSTSAATSVDMNITPRSLNSAIVHDVSEAERPQHEMARMSSDGSKLVDNIAGVNTIGTKMEQHKLTAGDTELISNVAHEQTQNHYLAPSQETQLKDALNLVANSGGNDDALKQLGLSIPELQNQSSGLGAAFKDALLSLGYGDSISHRDDGSTAMTIKEPGGGFGGSHGPAIVYKPSSTPGGAPTVTVDRSAR